MYSTDTQFAYAQGNVHEEATPPPGQQHLRLILDKHDRKGKKVTLIMGFIGSKADLEGLTRMLKAACGTGGSGKDGEILIQGDFRERIFSRLTQLGYHVKKG